MLIYETSGLKCLENSGSAHAGSNTHGDHAVFLFAPAQPMQQGGSADRAGRTQWVTQRYRPTQWIYFGGV